MKIKKLTAIIMIATTLTMGASTVAFAAPTETNTAGTTQTTTGDKTQTTTGDKTQTTTGDKTQTTTDDKNKDENKVGIKLTSKYEAVLLEVGQAFDPSVDLEIEAVDANDGDLSKALKFEKVDTSKAGLINYVIEAKNSKGETETLEIPIRIVNIVDSVKVSSLDEASKISVDSLVIDPVEGVDVSIESVDKEKGNLMVTITDGINVLTKAVALTDLEGKSLATGTDINKEDATDVTEGDKGTLPKTGTMSDLPIAMASFLSLLGVGYLATRKPQNN